MAKPVHVLKKGIKHNCTHSAAEKVNANLLSIKLKMRRSFVKNVWISQLCLFKGNGR